MALSSSGEFKGTDRFQVLGRLGMGGFGVVYRAFDRERKSAVALKLLRHVAAKTILRFKQEFRALSDISHPNLVTLFELLSDGDEWFFTMELVDGVDFLSYVREGCAFGNLLSGTGLSRPTSPALYDFFKQADARHPGTVEARANVAPATGTLNEQRLRHALLKLTDGLEALHQAGKIHRDIKASNVLVTDAGRVVLLDFGLVWELTPELMQTMDAMGTPGYMSPEQAARRALTAASDWYNVGVLLYEALTGRLPFVGDVVQVLQLKLEAEPVAPRQLAPEVPEDLAALCCDLLLREPEQRPSGHEILSRLRGSPPSRPAPTSAAAGTAPFVGRSHELAVLQDAFETARQGQTAIVSVHGGSGMGKSTLVRRFLTTLQEREPEAVILSGRCYERESVTYKALDALVDSLCQYLRRLPTAQAEALLPHDVFELARLFPVLQQVPVVAAARRKRPPVPDSLELRRRASRALREVMVRIADRKPLVLFIDDLHWGDRDSGALLINLLRPPDPPALLLIGCYRTEEADTSPLLAKLLPLRTDPGSVLGARDIVVGELPPPDAQELVIRLLESVSPLAKTRAEAIVREARGNPFFICELVRHSQAGCGTDALAGAGADATLDVVIRARAAQLPPEARRLLEVVAVAGRPVALAAAARAAGLEGHEQPALAPLRAGHWVRTRATPDGEEVEAYHDRIRDLVTALLTREALSDHHRRLAVSLCSSARVDPERLAIHFQEAGDSEIAARYAAASAAQAAEALAFDRAARLYRLALDLNAGSEAEQQCLMVGLGQALANAGRGAEAAGAYLAATATAAPGERLELQRRAAEQFLITGHIEEGFVAISAVLSQVGMRLAPTPRRALLGLLARRLWIRMRGLRFRERDASTVPDQDLMLIDTCWSVAVGLSLVDTFHGADFQARHLLLALAAGEPYRIARALALEAGHLATAGGPARARVERAVQAATTLAERVAHPHALGLVPLTAGIAAFLLGEWKKARALTERAESILRERCTGFSWELGTCHLWSLASLSALGELKQLSRRLESVLGEAQERGDLWLATSLRTRVGYLPLLAAHKPEAAQRFVKEAIDQWSHEGFHVQHMWCLFTQCEVDLYAGEAVSAWTRLAEQWPQLKRRLLLRIQSTRILTLSLRARCALARANREPESRWLRMAECDARKLQREHMVWAEPLATIVLAGIACVQGDVARSAALLVSAESSFSAADMALHAASARRRRGQLLGGEAGRELVATSESWMVEQGIKNPERLTAMLAPGFSTRA